MNKSLILIEIIFKHAGKYWNIQIKLIIFENILFALKNQNGDSSNTGYTVSKRVTIKAAILGLGMEIQEIPAQRKFVSSRGHAHSKAHNPPNIIGNYKC